MTTKTKFVALTAIFAALLLGSLLDNFAGVNLTPITTANRVAAGGSK